MNWLIPLGALGAGYVAHKKGVLEKIPVVGKAADHLMSKLPGGNRLPPGWSSDDQALYNQMMAVQGGYAVGMCGDAADLAAAQAAMMQDLGAQGYYDPSGGYGGYGGGGYGYCPYGGYGGLPYSPYGYCPTYGAQPTPSPYGYGSPYFGAQSPPFQPGYGYGPATPYGASAWGSPYGQCPSTPINPNTGMPYLTSSSPGVTHRHAVAPPKPVINNDRQRLARIAAANAKRQQQPQTPPGTLSPWGYLG